MTGAPDDSSSAGADDGAVPNPQAVLAAVTGQPDPHDVPVDAAAAPPVDAGRPPVDAGYDALRADVRAFVARELAPNVDAWEAAGALPRAAYEAAGAHGLFGHKVDADLGGNGVDFLADLVVTEELAACGSAGVAAAFGAHKDLGAHYVWRFGTDGQRRAHLPEAMAGRTITALAVTEPDAGSDVAALRATATPMPGGDWRLNGTKTFITNGAVANLYVVAALTDPDAGGHHGMTLLLVDAADSGVSRRRIPTLGWWPSHTAEVALSDVHLPADRILGGPARLGDGFACIMRNFEWERISMAVAAVRGVEETLATAADARADAPTRRRLADAAADVAAARSLTDHAVRRSLAGADATAEVAMAKSFACDASLAAAEAAVAAVGPEATRAGHPLERALRDARLGPIGGGTREIMHELVARTWTP